MKTITAAFMSAALLSISVSAYEIDFVLYTLPIHTGKCSQVWASEAMAEERLATVKESKDPLQEALQDTSQHLMFSAYHFLMWMTCPEVTIDG